VAQLVEALRYKTEGREFDSRWCQWNYSLTQPLTEMGKDGWCVRLTTLQPSLADCLEIWELQPLGTLRACRGVQWGCFTFYMSNILVY
jgi:hypothetical protein